ncbi:MAG: hypothetical protein KBT00_03340 [Bacteroidales bacterium]|nr:hypothetical protein [Candidatus Cacconaster merdequi]
MKRILISIVLAISALIIVSCGQDKTREPGYIVQVSIGDWHSCNYNPEDVIARIEEVSKIIPVEKVMVGWCLEREPYEKIGAYLHKKGIQFILYLPIFSEIEDMFQARPAVDLWGGLPPEELMAKVSGFRFNCPVDPVTYDSITAIFEKNFKDLDFDGVFLDRIRTQSFVGGVSGVFECGCPECAEKYMESGVNLETVRDEYEKEGDAFFSVEGYTPAEGFRFVNPVADAYFKAKGAIVSSQICRLADYFRNQGMLVGFDLFAPIVSQFVGQDYALLAQHADFIKPMLYRITDAPAGIGYEYELIRKSVPQAEGYGPLVMDLDFLKGQLEAMKDLPCKIYPGIEINRSGTIVNSTPEYLVESIRELIDYGCDGAVLSWNIMQAPDENIAALRSIE